MRVVVVEEGKQGKYTIELPSIIMGFLGEMEVELFQGSEMQVNRCFGKDGEPIKWQKCNPVFIELRSLMEFL